MHLGVRPRGEGAEQRQDLPIRARQLGRLEPGVAPCFSSGLRHPPDQRPLRRRAADGGTLPRGGGRHLGQGLQERGDPAVHVEGLDPGPERREPDPPLLARHRERAVEDLGRAVHVVRIDLQRLGKLPRGAGELAQHQHAVAVGARGDELLGDEVHPVAQRRHQHHVGCPVERHQVGLRQRAEDVVDRHPARRAESAVDPADEAVHQRPEILVGAHVGPRGDRHLHQTHPFPELGVRVEHPLVREEPAGDPLGVVEPVHPDEYPHAAVAADGRRLARHRRVVRELGERGRVHAHREDAEPHLARGELHAVDLYGEAQDVGQGGGEVPEVCRRVEAHQVRAEHPLEQAVPRGQGAEQLFGRERDVEEEADARTGQPLAQ